LAFNKAVQEIAQKVYETEKDYKKLAVIGIHTNGVFIAKRICAEIEKQIGFLLPFGTIDIAFYRDDIDNLGSKMPAIKDSVIPFDVTGKNVLLVDDTLYTGRTVRAALDAIISFGRPEAVKLAVLVDRGHRELPIQADFVGFKQEIDGEVKVECKENGKEDKAFVL
jgi:pyrimidine operon attenuation protein/uracil phosphoribosyltransferase